MMSYPMKKPGDSICVGGLNVALTARLKAIKKESIGLQPSLASLLQSFLVTQKLDVAGFSEIKGASPKKKKGEGDWLSDKDVQGLGEFSVTGYRLFYRRGKDGQYGVGMAISKKIPILGAERDHPYSSAEDTRIATWRKDYPGRLLIVEAEIGNFVFVTVYGPTLKNGGAVYKNVFWQPIRKLLIQLIQERKNPVVLGDFNLKPEDLETQNLHNIGLKNVMEKCNKVRNTYYSQYEDCYSYDRPEDGVFNLAWLNIDDHKGVSVDTVLFCGALTLQQIGGEKMCGCEESCSVPCSSPECAMCADQYLIGRVNRGEALEQVQANSRRFPASRYDNKKPKSPDKNLHYQIRDQDYKINRDCEYAGCFFQESGKSKLDHSLQFPFPQNFPLIRYFPPWFTDHMLVLTNITVPDSGGSGSGSRAGSGLSSGSGSGSGAGSGLSSGSGSGSGCGPGPGSGASAAERTNETGSGSDQKNKKRVIDLTGPDQENKNKKAKTSNDESEVIDITGSDDE